MPLIKLQSSDGELFSVDTEIAKQSITIRTMLEDLGKSPLDTIHHSPASFDGSPICSVSFMITPYFTLLRTGNEEEEDEVVPLPNVNAAILRKVIQWCSYHKDDPAAPEEEENKEKRSDDISSWDADFLKVDQGTLFELILVSSTHRLVETPVSV